MINSPSRLLSIVLLSLVSCTVLATPVTPTYGTFANLPGATFGGSGIPTNPTAITTVGNLTLGLAATQRYVGPNLLHDGAGTYFANPGSTPGSPPIATWNFSFYINDSQNALNANGRTYQLLYDFDTGANTDDDELGIIDFAFATSGSTIQGSENLSFSYLSATSLFITPPDWASFDPLANGQYSFALIAYEGGREIARSAINVQVGDVPEPATMALVGLSLFGMAGMRKLRLRRKQ